MPTCAVETCYDMHITGTVVTGKGEGGSYISRPGYQEQFRQRLDMQPFPGTLNLRLQGDDVERFANLQEHEGIHIAGFQQGGQTFGAVTCYPCVVNDTVKGAIVIPQKSVYHDVMEIVADVCLRDTLHLQDGDPVTVTVETSAGD
ncbi:MAG: DUF120 domain-containing protein [Thermoplasmatota archaeon]